MDLIMTGLEFFHKGGPVMYVLLLCSVFVVAIAVERAGFSSVRMQGAALPRHLLTKLPEVMPRRLRSWQKIPRAFCQSFW